MIWALKMSIALLQIVDGVVCLGTLALLRPSFSVDARLVLLRLRAMEYEG